MADNKNNRHGTGNYKDNTGRTTSHSNSGAGNKSGKRPSGRSPYAAYSGQTGTSQKASGNTGKTSGKPRQTGKPIPEGTRKSRTDKVSAGAVRSGGRAPGSKTPPPIPNPESGKKKKPENTRFKLLKKAAAILGTTLLSIFLVVVITGTIVATAMTVYVLEFMDESTDVTIKELENSANTIVYANDGDKLVQLYAVKSEIQRVPVDIEEIPQHVRDAFVCIEDERFYSHEGVDYKRTFAAFANMFMHIYDTRQGGSTITQQLIKNLTGDDEQSPERKIREIFRAMQFEKKYSKDEILENYLNYIGFGGPTNGIQLASIKYFGKNVSDLSIAEAACLAAIPKSPETINPFAGYYDDDDNWVNTGKEANRERQESVLSHMYSNGTISYDQYQDALNEKLVFTDSDEYKKAHPEADAEDLMDEQKATSWVVDTALREYAQVIMDQYGIDEEEAIKRINGGGYQIYTTVDMEMQKYVEEKYSDLNNLMDAESNSSWTDDDEDGEYDQSFPESAFIAMDYNGNILSVVGGVGEKTESLAFNRATMAKRQPGSCIKPITTYGLALYSDHIHWGSMYKDSPIKIDGEEWPNNYDYVWRRTSMFIFEALRQSRNTVPAQLCDELTPQAVFDFATNNLNVDLVDLTDTGATDIAYAPLTIGALTYGISPENLVNAYMPYGNGGTYCDAHIISKVEKGDGSIVYENDGNPHEAVDPETAFVMNHLLQEVVLNGTGTAAQLSNKTVAGKTGTSEDWNDLCFVGLTEDFVSGVWIGYDTKTELNHGLSSAQVWSNIIGEYANSIESDNSYPDCDTVIVAPMCSSTGLIAESYCPKGITGYWKSSNAPTCSNHSSAPKKEEATTQAAEESSSESESSESSAPESESESVTDPVEDPVSSEETPPPDEGGQGESVAE